MENKKLFTFFGIFALLVLSLTLTSAVPSFSINLVSPVNGSTTMSRDVSFTFGFSSVTSGEDYTCDLNIDGLHYSSTSAIDETTTNTITANNLAIGNHTWNIYCDGPLTDATSETRKLTILPDSSGYEFCKYGEVGTELSVEYIKDRKDENDKEWEWRPLDNIELDVKIENLNDDDNIDTIVALILVDSSGKEVSDWATDEDDLEQEVGLDDGESKKVTFNFQISADVNDGSNYRIYAKVYEDGDEDKQCASLRAEEIGTEETVSIDKNRNDVLVKEVDAVDTTTCGSVINLEAKVYNIGDEDEDKVKVIFYNKELGITLEKEIENLDSGDSDTVDFSFNIPKNADEKSYKFILTTEFKYDDKDDEYDKSSDEKDDFEYYLKVLGSCTGDEPVINARLLSGAKVGEEMSIEVSITNRDTSSEFIVSPTGYESWAELVSVDPSISSIGQDQTSQVVIKLRPTVSGSQSFTINVISNGQTKTQPVTVTIEEKTGLFTGSFAGLSNLGENLGTAGAFLLIGIIALLVLIVIVLIVKLASRPAHQEF